MQAYKKACDEHITVYERKGNAYPFLSYQVPSYNSSEIGRKYVYLRNCSGEIARYNIKTGEITVWMWWHGNNPVPFFIEKHKIILLIPEYLLSLPSVRGEIRTIESISYYFALSKIA